MTVSNRVKSFGVGEASQQKRIDANCEAEELLYDPLGILNF